MVDYISFHLRKLFWCIIVQSYKTNYKLSLFITNLIGGEMFSVLTPSAVDSKFELRSGQTKDYKIGMCCFSAKHAALRRKSKD